MAEKRRLAAARVLKGRTQLQVAEPVALRATEVYRSEAGRSVPDDEILTKADLAAKLKVTVRCIENWQGAGHLRYLKIAGVVRFHWPEVLAHLKKKYQVCHGSVAPGELADAQVVKAETLPGDVTGRLHGPRKAEMGGGR